MPATEIISGKANNGLADKIRLIRDFYVGSLRVPAVRAYAEKAGMDHKTGRPSISALFIDLRSHVRYIPDPVGAELIKNPALMISDIKRQGWTAGDCDDFASLAYTLLRSVGIAAELAVVWYGDDADPRHVLAVVPMKDRTYLPFDLVAPKLGVTKGGPSHWRLYA